MERFTQKHYLSALLKPVFTLTFIVLFSSINFYAMSMVSSCSKVATKGDP